MDNHCRRDSHCGMVDFQEYGILSDSLDQLVSFSEISYSKLSIGCSPVIILYDRIADIYRITGFDMLKVVSHVESYR